MMTKNKNPLKGKIRDKVKRVILIDGVPKQLYDIRERNVVIIKLNGKSYRSEMSQELADELKKLPTLEITTKKRQSIRFKKLEVQGLGHRTSIRKINKNTHITIGASDEQQLYERVEKIKEYLSFLGINGIQKCHWVCSTEKGKMNENNLNKEKEEQSPVETKTITVDKNEHEKLTVIKNKESLKKEMSEKTKKLREIYFNIVNEAKP